jgi:rare lipoprotein A
MRLPVDGRRARFAKLATALTLALALGAWGTTAGAARRAPPPAVPVNGPQADYPVVVGAPYAVEGTEYVPEDVLNYDRVGLVAADDLGGSAISGAHHTLPLPSYIEVTSLDTGRTALVRLERRGPMTGQELVALSPGALDQLGLTPGAPVRVRRVNPPEDQRALLRAGQSAPLRMDTPMLLVEVLRRKLPGATPAPVQVASATPVAAPPASPSQTAPQAPVARPSAGPPPLPSLNSPGLATVVAAPAATQPARAPAAPRAAADQGGFIVQAAAFSTADRATRVAGVLGGEVSRSGQYYRVRTGPFATRNEAEASLAKVRAAGYRDARIFTSG